METLTTNKQSDALGTGIASENNHWYDKAGTPVYTVPMTSKAGDRPTNIKDARKLDLVPSVTLILNTMAKPGLEAWKAKQLLEASLTLPRKQGESLDDYARRIVEDSKAQGIAAADRGTQLHKAIEDYIRNKACAFESVWFNHLVKLELALSQHGIDLHAGQSEHSFSANVNGLCYGGKIDYHKRNDECVLIDFKSKDRIEDKKLSVYDEHQMQLAAYGYGLFGRITSSKPWAWDSFRALNVFVGVQDCEVRVFEHNPQDLENAFELFQCLLSFWSRKNHFGKFAKEKL